MSLRDDKDRAVAAKKKEVEEYNEKKKTHDGDYAVRLMKWSFGPGRKSGKDQYVLTWKVTEKGPNRGKECKIYHPLHVNDFFTDLLNVLEGAGIDLDSLPSMEKKPSVIDEALDSIEEAGQLKAIMTVLNKEGKSLPELTIHDIKPLFFGKDETEDEEESIEAP